jgi:hypothetical protein
MGKTSAQRQADYVARMRALGLTQVKVWVGEDQQIRSDLKELERREIEKASARKLETNGQLTIF